MATDSNEMEVSGVLVTNEALRHSASLEEGGRASLDNPPFSMRPKRMGRPALSMTVKNEAPRRRGFGEDRVRRQGCC